MHEMSIAQEVCRIAELHVGRGRLAAVTGVGLEVGDEAGVEFENLEFCLDTLLSMPPFGGATAHIDRRSGDVLRVCWLEVDE